MKFRNWLRNVIEELGLKQQALAQQVGVSQATISTWLNSDAEKDRPRADSLIKLAEVTHEDPYKLFNMVYGLPLPGEQANAEAEVDAILRRIMALPEPQRRQAEQFIDFLLQEARKNADVESGKG